MLSNLRLQNCDCRSMAPHLSLGKLREKLFTGFLEERGADLALLLVQQVDAEERAGAFGIGPRSDFGLGRDARLDRPLVGVGVQGIDRHGDYWAVIAHDGSAVLPAAVSTIRA